MIGGAIKLIVNSYISVNIKHFPHLVSSRLGFHWINFQLSGTNCETRYMKRLAPVCSRVSKYLYT